MAFTLTPMAFGDKRIVSFKFTRWLLEGDSISGSPTLSFSAPMAAISFLGASGSVVTCLITAGAYAGTGQISCEVETTMGEKATRTAAVPIVALNYNATS